MRLLSGPLALGEGPGGGLPLPAEEFWDNLIIREDPEDGGYVVSCPAIPGCHSQGETLEEGLENIKDAISGCIEVLNERVTQRPGERPTDVVL